MEIGYKRLRLSTIWLGIIIALVIYALRGPIYRIPYYRFLYIGTYIYVIFTHYKNNGKESISSSLRCTQICWILLALWGSILIPFTYDLGGSLDELVWIFCMCAVSTVFCFYSKNENGINSILSLYMLFSSLIAIIGLYESLTGHIINITAGSYHYRKNFVGLYSPNTIFYNINDNAVFMTMSLFIAWVYAKGRKHEKLLKILAIILYAGNILMVNSRGSELAILAFFVLQFLQARQRHKNIVRTGTVIVVIMLLLTVFLESGLLPNYIFEESRLIIWANTIKNLKESAFLGVGAGNIMILNRNESSIIASDPHNFFLELIANYGIVGAILLAIWYTKLLVNARKLGKEDIKCKTIFNALICFFPLSIVSSSLIGKSWVLCFFGLLIAQLNFSYLSLKITKSCK